LAATNKCSARNNKSQNLAKATNKRPQRGAPIVTRAIADGLEASASPSAATRDYGHANSRETNVETFKNSLGLALAGLIVAFVVIVAGGYVELPSAVHSICITHATTKQSTGCAFLIQYN
jgi:hypothetical protein